MPRWLGGSCSWSTVGVASDFLSYTFDEVELMTETQQMLDWQLSMSTSSSYFCTGAAWLKASVMSTLIGARCLGINYIAVWKRGTHRWLCKSERESYWTVECLHQFSVSTVTFHHEIKSSSRLKFLIKLHSSSFCFSAIIFSWGTKHSWCTTAEAFPGHFKRVTQWGGARWKWEYLIKTDTVQTAGVENIR